MSRVNETTLYRPVKLWLEARGFVVKGEVGAADVLACRDGCEPVIVELKAGFSLTLLQQAVARQSVTDAVYVAVPRWSGKAGWRAFKGNLGLCRRLGLGVLSIDLGGNGAVQLHCEPAPFRPRKSRRKRDRLLDEFERREGDPNAGGMTRQGIVTAYRQEALRCARILHSAGPCKGAVVARDAQVRRATRLMADNHYGWFERVKRGVYGLSATGAAMLSDEAPKDDPVRDALQPGASQVPPPDA